MAAVIGPVGVDHAQLRDGRVALLCPEIVPAEADVVEIHRKAALFDQLREFLVAAGAKARECLDLRGNLIADLQRLGQRQRRLARVDGVDDVLFDGRKLRVRQRTVEQVHARRAHVRPLALRDDLDALRGRVCPLVELTRQILHGEHARPVRVGLARDEVDLRLGEHRLHGVVKQLRRDVLHVIAVQDAHPLEVLHAGQLLGLAQQAARVVGQLRFFFNKYTVYHVTFPP